MYNKNAGQIRMEDTIFRNKQITLPKDNRWVQIAELIPWWEYEDAYASKLKSIDKGNGALSVRTALGALIIKATLSLSDRETVKMIAENPAMQYLVDLEIAYGQQPFAPSLMVDFRKRLPSGLIQKINEDLVVKMAKASQEKNDEKASEETADDGSSPSP